MDLNSSVPFASSSLWGKFGGLNACGDTFSYILPLPNSLANPFVFKKEIEKEGLPRGSTPVLGAGVRRFKTLRRKLPNIPAALQHLSFRQMSTSFSSSCNNRNLKYPFRR